MDSELKLVEDDSTRLLVSINSLKNRRDKLENRLGDIDLELKDNNRILADINTVYEDLRDRINGLEVSVGQVALGSSSDIID